ncbi:uncharacterized protein LOC121725461 [Aricia agestis]|uniref:uncharacterized protein LOC121725461 n=1 Tax=Aricia agestis TaxID=91739 RepID=UPI001C20C3A0|nr:uncharacterized protein LOC121725461 [Aricia agestis]
MCAANIIPAFIVALVLNVGADIASECDLAGFYLELGCTPVPGTAKCPEAFTCPDLHPKDDMCYYRGVPYTDGSMVPQNVVRNPCSQACGCRVTAGAPAFNCAAVDCVEFYNPDQKDCVFTYELGACCSTGTVCGKDAIAALKTCEVEGKTYKEGQTFELGRKTCVCTADWSPDTGCRDLDCGLELHYQDQIHDGCAPVFVGDKKGCPIAFECSTANSTVVRGLNTRGVGAQCRFGSLTLVVGDEVTAADPCMRCACDMPPFVTCSKKTSCDQ